MPSQRNGHAVYELSGRALAAAKRLEAELAEELKTVPVKRLGNLKEIGDSWDALYDGLRARLAAEAPDVLKETGLTSPSTQVFKGVQTLPRAYAEYPQIFLSPEKNPRYFMYAPIDYKGRHFAPQDSKKLDNKQADAVGNLLFAGGWLGNAPLVNTKKQGVATPADYKAPAESTLRKQFPYMPNDRVCFIARGRSLEAVQDMRARTKAWEKSLKTACRAIEAEVKKDKALILANLPMGEDVRISATYSYSMGGQDKARLILSIRREGKDNMWNAGKTVPVPPNPAFDATPRHGDECEVSPRRDTPEGIKLAALIDAIPFTPTLADYPALHANYTVKHTQISRALGVGGVVPQVADVEGLTVLLYNAAPADKKKAFCPPDAVPMPAAVYDWLHTDQGDRNMGLTPPPRPPEVTAVLSALAKAPAAQKKPKNPKP